MDKLFDIDEVNKLIEIWKSLIMESHLSNLRNAADRMLKAHEASTAKKLDDIRRKEKADREARAADEAVRQQKATPRVYPSDSGVVERSTDTRAFNNDPAVIPAYQGGPAKPTDPTGGEGFNHEDPKPKTVSPADLRRL